MAETRYYRAVFRLTVWAYRVGLRLGLGHWCDYDDPQTGEYLGFCQKRGMHRGREN